MLGGLAVCQLLLFRERWGLGGRGSLNDSVYSVSVPTCSDLSTGKPGSSPRMETYRLLLVSLLLVVVVAMVVVVV